MHYAKDGPDDILMRVIVRNAGPDAATLHVLPTLWFRNTWAFDPEAARPTSASGRADRAASLASHPELGDYELLAGPGPDGRPPDLLFCENETNVARLYGLEPATPYPKDGINDHVVGGVGHGESRWRRARRRPPGTAWTWPREPPSSCGCGCAP